MTEVKVIQDQKWGRLIKLSNEICEVSATLDFGPRIIRYSYIGEENVFFEDINDEIHNSDSEAVYGKGKWHIYGGHRVQMAPENVYNAIYPDNDPVEYEIIKGGVILTPPKQMINDIQYTITITLDDDSTEVKVMTTVHNGQETAIERAIWCLSVMRSGGAAVAPVNTSDEGYLPNRRIALWSYTDIHDKRLSMDNEYIVIRQDKNAAGPFKIGADNPKGVAGYLNDGTLFISKFNYEKDAVYPDYNVNFEVYTNRQMIEVEALDKLQIIPAGGKIDYSMSFMLKKLPTGGDSIENVQQILNKI